MLQTLFNRINLGEPTFAGSLCVFPVYPLDPPAMTLTLIADAVARGEASVEEVEADGDAPWFRRLGIRTRGPQPVLIRDSDLLKGGRQDRTIEQTCLVAGGERTIIPTLCVEQSRSYFSGAHDFSVSRSSVDSVVRSQKMRSSFEGRELQGETWNEVAKVRTSSGLRDGSGSLHEVDELSSARLAKVEAALPPVYLATGVVVVAPAGDRRASIVAEFFADAAACAAAWPGLIRAGAMRCGGDAEAPRVSRTEVRRFLRAAAKAKVAPAPSVGLGQLTRLSFGRSTGTVLSLGDQLVHAALIAA